MREELGTIGPSLLCLLAMLLQLLFSTAHLASFAPLEGGEPNALQSLSFWEICTRDGFVKLPLGDDDSSRHNTDHKDCAICATAAAQAGLSPGPSLPALPAMGLARDLPKPVAILLVTGQLMRRAGASRAPPLA